MRTQRSWPVAIKSRGLVAEGTREIYGRAILEQVVHANMEPSAKEIFGHTSGHPPRSLIPQPRICGAHGILPVRQGSRTIRTQACCRENAHIGEHAQLN